MSYEYFEKALETLHIVSRTTSLELKNKYYTVLSTSLNIKVFNFT